MTLADARALEPAIRPVDADFAADARALDGLGRLVRALYALGRAGCAGRHFPRHHRLLASVRRRGAACRRHRRAAEARQGILPAPRSPIRPVPPGRWRVHGAERYAIVRPGHGRQALAGLPVEGLRLPAETAAGLRRVGMRRIGDLYAMPRAGITAQFGVIVTRRLDLALAISPEPISPRRPVPPHIARAAFAEPISTPENLTTATRHLLDELCAGLERAGQGARRLDLGFFRVDGRVERSSIGTSRPVRAPLHLARLFAEKLDRVEPGPGVEIMILAATAEPLAAAQIAMRIGAPAPLSAESVRMRPNWLTGWATASGCPGCGVCCHGKAGGRRTTSNRAAALDPDRAQAGTLAVRPLPSRPPAGASRTHPRHGPGAGRSADDVPLARYPAQGRPGRRTGAAGAGMVARTDRTA